MPMITDSIPEYVNGMMMKEEGATSRYCLLCAALTKTHWANLFEVFETFTIERRSSDICQQSVNTLVNTLVNSLVNSLDNSLDNLLVTLNQQHIHTLSIIYPQKGECAIHPRSIGE